MRNTILLSLLLFSLTCASPSKLQTPEQKCVARVKSFNMLVQTNDEASNLLFSYIELVRELGSQNTKIDSLVITDTEIVNRVYDYLYKICIHSSPSTESK